MDKDPDLEAIRAQATIYKKETARSLSSYQKQINEVAQEIKNPSMLRSRSALLEAARVKVNESYQFKKGKSRSKTSKSYLTVFTKMPKDQSVCSIDKNEDSGR